MLCQGSYYSPHSLEKLAVLCPPTLAICLRLHRQLAYRPVTMELLQRQFMSLARQGQYRCPNTCPPRILPRQSALKSLYGTGPNATCRCRRQVVLLHASTKSKYNWTFDTSAPPKVDPKVKELPMESIRRPLGRTRSNGEWDALLTCLLTSLSSSITSENLCSQIKIRSLPLCKASAK